VRYSAVFLLLLLSFPKPAQPGRVEAVVPLPSLKSVTAMQRDAAGNVYFGGRIDSDAFVAKLSSAGKVLFWRVLSGSQSDEVTALALRPDGSILAVGNTTSSDFPVTRDAAESQNNVAPDRSTGFFVRLDPNGKVAYASYLNGINLANAQTSYPTAITTDASGAAYITGFGLFASTDGALPPIRYYNSGRFIVKLDASGKLVFSTGAIGGRLIAIDALGYIYVAGTEEQNYPLPLTPLPLQLQPRGWSDCGGTGQVSYPCSHQFIAKLDPAASSLNYCTWLTGSQGASPNGLWVDSMGNAILAGSTESSDYPVTRGAFQTKKFATEVLYGNLQFGPIYIPGPPATGYVTKVNADGSGFIFSTFLGGVREDTIRSMALDSQGNIYLAGVASSPDFPGLSGVPDGCRPSYIYPLPFVTRLSEDGSKLTDTQILFGLPAGPGIALRAAFDGKGKSVLVAGSTFASADLFADAPDAVCARDAADFAPLLQVVPGQLVALFGSRLGGSEGLSFQPQDGHVPVSLGDGVGVAFNGVAAPILYSSASQINLQVPYELAGQATAKLEIRDHAGAMRDGGDFGVAVSAPSALVTGAEYARCGAATTTWLLPGALNEDGSQNSCGNPAAPGSTVSVFLNGLGLAGESPSTGAIAASPSAPLPVEVGTHGSVTLISAESTPGTINSVWTVKLKVTSGWAASFTLTVGGVPLREPLVVWTTGGPVTAPGGGG
jgi:uncharacterized protein (TIGR03437 family)